MRKGFASSSFVLNLMRLCTLRGKELLLFGQPDGLPSFS